MQCFRALGLVALLLFWPALGLAQLTQTGAGPKAGGSGGGGGMVLFDSKTATVQSTTGGITISFSFTVGAGTNRALAVPILWQSSTVPPGATAVWDSGGTNQAMTVIPGTATGAHGGCSCSGLIYGLLAPTSGTHTLTVSWTGTLEAHLTAISFTGVDQTSIAVAFPHGTQIVNDLATPSPITGPVTSATGNIVIAQGGQHTSAFGAISGTTIAVDASTGPALTYASSYSAGAATVSPTIAFGADSPWPFVATDVLASGGGGGPGVPTVASVSPNNGLDTGGTPVTISGTNFTGATSVTFGGTAATGVSVVNALTINGTTPAHLAGLVNVAVTGPGGTGTGTNAYNYVGSGATILPAANDISANWVKAGLAPIGGIPNRLTQCGANLTTSGLVPPQAGDDASKLNAAIAACPPGSFIQMAAGTFNYALSELPIVINKGITLRGFGTPVSTCNAATGTPCWPTVLQTYDGPQPTYQSPAQCGVTIGSTSACPNTSGFFMLAPNGPFDFGWGGCNPNIANPTASNCGSALAIDAAQGALTIQVAQTSSFAVGMWVLLDEWPAMVTTTNPVPGQASILASPEFLTASAAPAVMRLANPDGGNNMAACTSGGNPGYSFCINRLNQEIHKVASIGAGPCPGAACTLTFDSPLTLAFRQSGSHDARAYWPQKQNGVTANPFVEQVGIENLTITRATGGSINFEFCAYCWVKNVEVNYWIAGAVNFTYAVRSQVTGSYLHNCIDCQNNGSEYPIGISVASTEILIDNSIVTFGGKGMVARAAGAGSVIGYNYVDKTFYMTGTGIGNYWNDMALNCTHYGGAHGCLFEGNWAANCGGDETHGNAVYMTFFRNQCNGGRTTFVDPSSSQTVNDCAGIGFADPGNTPQSPGPLRAGGPMAFNYWYAYIGNVMGFSGMQSCAGGPYTYGANSAGAIANRIMWRSGWTGGEWGTVPDANLVSGTPFIFRNGNFDYVNASIVDFAAGFAHTFQNSLYLPSSGASPPSWWPSGSTTYPFPWIDSTSGTPVKSNSLSGSGLPAKARFDAGTPFVQP